MIQGAQSVQISSCSAIKSYSGFDPTKGLTLVRNPNYNPATDTSTGRKAYVNAMQFTIDTNVGDIFDKIQAGQLDLSWYDPPPKTVVNQYLSTPSLRSHFKTISAGATEYFQMNLAQPPFDDIHVRKAVNYILDRAAIQQVWGGTYAGQIATHLIPSNVLGNVPASNFDLYPSSGDHGDLAKAQAEMRLSGYDPKQDGMCDVAACKNVVMINGNTSPWTEMAPIIVQDLAKIGIQIVPRNMDFGAAFGAIETPKNKIPSQIAVGWGYDYPDAYPYYASLFQSSAIQPSGNTDFSLVGLTPQKARSLGIPYPSTPISSIDPQIAQCEATTVGTARLNCWANLERSVMQNVVPIAPLIWYNLLDITGSDVTSYATSPQQGQALVNIAVSNSLSPAP